MATLEYLSELERKEVIKFNNNLVLSNAVKKVLLESIYNNGVLRKDNPPDPLRNAALGLSFQTLAGKVISNEDLGADLRGLSEGINLLEKGLFELSKIKEDSKDVVSPLINEAI